MPMGFGPSAGVRTPSTNASTSCDRDGRALDLGGGHPGLFRHSLFFMARSAYPHEQTGTVEVASAAVFFAQGTRSPTTAGVPQGGRSSPVISTLVLDGLEAVGCGGRWHRRVHHINGVRWADDVRHITRCPIPVTERRGAEVTPPGSTTHLEAQATGDKSRSRQRRRPAGVYDRAPPAPRDTVRARLPTPQWPALEADLPCPQRLLAGAP